AVTMGAWSTVRDDAPTSLWAGAAEITEKPPSYPSTLQVLAERAPAPPLAARLPPSAAGNADRGHPRHPGGRGAHDQLGLSGHPQARHERDDCGAAGRPGAGRRLGQPRCAHLLALVLEPEPVPDLPAGDQRRRDVPDHRWHVRRGEALLHPQSRGRRGRTLGRLALVLV